MQPAPARRRSIFGGLLLTLLGTYFLLANLLPELNLWSAFWRYWPALLILWGVARLVDYRSARRAGQAPPRTLTAGEFVLVLLLIGVVGVISLVRQIRTDPDRQIDLVLPWDRAFSFPEEVTSEVVATDAALDILIPRGNIEIVAEEASQIRAVVSKRAYAFSERDARRAADQASLRIVKTDSGYALQPEWREGRRLGNIYFDLTVHVPRSMPLRIQSVRGNLRAAGLTGRLDVELRRGDVEIRNAGSAVRVKLRQGDVRIHAVRGDVIVEGPGDLVEVSEVAGALTIQGNFSGPIQISRVQGETTFRSSRTNLSVGRIAGQLELSGGQLTLTDSSGPVSLITRSYDITMENIEGELRIENRSSGDIRLQFRRPPQQPVQVRNEKGDIELTLPAEATFALQAIAQRGEIESDFTGAGLEKTDREEAVELRGRVGARGPNIRLETTYGTIRLRRGP
ncbi:MAG: DUF4097 family beta strand repeat-containing protein [Acidobacteriia bacterium]|jgi:DUF4097 and DUF4098 domain-containing protein YvlB|nr:DUF4097 family beta strand repeat-containing protein [Terriglobia bacterium]